MLRLPDAHPTVLGLSLRWWYHRHAALASSRWKRRGLPGSWGTLAFMPCSKTPVKFARPDREGEVSEEELRFSGGFRPGQCAHFLVSPLVLKQKPRGFANVAFRHSGRRQLSRCHRFRSSMLAALSARCPCFATFLPGRPATQDSLASG